MLDIASLFDTGDKFFKIFIFHKRIPFEPGVIRPASGRSNNSF